MQQRPNTPPFKMADKPPNIYKESVVTTELRWKSQKVVSNTNTPSFPFPYFLTSFTKKISKMLLRENMRNALDCTRECVDWHLLFESIAADLGSLVDPSENCGVPGKLVGFVGFWGTSNHLLLFGSILLCTRRARLSQVRLLNWQEQVGGFRNLT